MAQRAEADKILLDMMAIHCLKDPDIEKKVGTKTAKELEAECDQAAAIYSQKYFALKKGQRLLELKKLNVVDERCKISDAENKTVTELEKKLTRLSEQEKSIKEDIKRFRTNGLSHLVLEHSDTVLPQESKERKECKEMHNLACFQAELLQQLVEVIDIDPFKLQYVDKLSNSVLTGSYDFLKES